MAIIQPLILSPIPKAESRDTISVLWTGLANGDSGAPVEIPGYHVRSAQVLNTLGAGGTVAIEGSNLPAPSADADYGTLPNAQGTALAVTALGISSIGAPSRWIRPRVTAGDGTTAVTVAMILVRT